MNKFEHVSSPTNQMFLGAGALYRGETMAMYRGRLCTEGALYNEVQCIMGNGHIGPPGQTDMTENITFLQLRWRAVKMRVLTRGVNHKDIISNKLDIY